jgi:hypothetical protein
LITPVPGLGAKGRLLLAAWFAIATVIVGMLSTQAPDHLAGQACQADQTDPES